MICLLVVLTAPCLLADTSPAVSSATSLSTRVHAEVNQTWRLQHGLLHQPRTKYGGRTNRLALKRWQEHHRLWKRRTSQPQWVLRAIWPPATWSTLRCVITRESGWNPQADNPYSTAAGLLQILGGPKTVWGNLEMGYAMFKERGWQPWIGGYPSCGIY